MGPVEKINSGINLALSRVLLLLALFFLPGLRDIWWKQAPPIYEATTTPIGAVEWLIAHPDLPGQLWNDYAFGSYLAFALPSRQPWIDTRMYSFPPEQWQAYAKISEGNPAWDYTFARADVNLLLLSTTSQPRLIEAVKASGQWCEQYHDAYSVIFLRCKSAL